MLPLIFWALVALGYAHAYSQTRLAATLLATAAAYTFLPGYLFLACPLLSYNSLPKQLFTVTSLRNLPLILCALSVAGWAAGASISDGMYFLADAIFDPRETIIETFIDAFYDGLDAINFQEGLAQDKEELASLWPVATNLIVSPSTVYRAAVEGQNNVRANIIEAPNRYFGLSIHSPKNFFVSNMGTIMVVLALIFVYRWIASRSRPEEIVDPAVNAEVFAYIKAQDVEIDVADANVCAIQARCETLLSSIWVNVFCPGARRHIQVLEMESIPRSLPHRKPRASKDAMSILRHRLGVRPGLNMPTARQIETYDPVKKYIALDAIRSENLYFLKSLAEDEHKLLALEQRLEQLNLAIQQDALTGHPHGRRGLIAWTLADSEPDLQRYDNYLDLKQQNPTAPHLETFQKYEFYLASGQQHRLPLALMPQEPSSPISPISPISRFSDSIESQWSNVQKSLCVAGQAPISQPTPRTTIYNRARHYTFPESRPVIPVRNTISTGTGKLSASDNHANIYRHRPARHRQVHTKLDSIFPDIDPSVVPGAVPDTEASKALPPPKVPKPVLEAEARRTTRPAARYALQAQPAQDSGKGIGKAKIVPSKPVPVTEPRHDRESQVDTPEPSRPDTQTSGPSSVAKVTEKSHTAAGPKRKGKKVTFADDIDVFDQALKAFSGLRLEDLPPLPPSPTLPDAPLPPLPPLPPFPTKISPKQPHKPAAKTKSAGIVTHRAQTRRNLLLRPVADSGDLQKCQQAAKIEGIYSSIPQHIHLNGWPERYLPRRAFKATCKKSTIYRPFHLHVERTWTRRARGRRRVETQPTLIESSASILESIEEAPTTAPGGTPADASISGLSSNPNPASTHIPAYDQTPTAPSADMAGDSLADVFAGISVEDLADSSAEDLADALASDTAQTSDEVVGDAAIDNSTDVSNEVMNDAPTDAPTDASIRSSADRLSGAPAHILTAEDLVDAPAKTSTRDVTDTAVNISADFPNEDLADAPPAPPVEASTEISTEDLIRSPSLPYAQLDVQPVVASPATTSDKAAAGPSLVIVTSAPMTQASASVGEAAGNVSDEDKEFWRELFGTSPESSSGGSDDDSSDDAIVHEGDIMDTDFASDWAFNIKKKKPARAARQQASASTSAPAPRSLPPLPLPAFSLPMPANPLPMPKDPLPMLAPPAVEEPAPAPAPAPAPTLISALEQNSLPHLNPQTDPTATAQDGAAELTEGEIDELNAYRGGTIVLDEITGGHSQDPKAVPGDQSETAPTAQQRAAQPARFTFDFKLTAPNPFTSQTKPEAISPTALTLSTHLNLPQPAPTTSTTDKPLETDSDIAQLEGYLKGDIDSDDLDSDGGPSAKDKAKSNLDTNTNEQNKTAQATQHEPMQFTFEFPTATTNPFSRQSSVPASTLPDLPAAKTLPQPTTKASIDEKPLVEENEIDILEAYLRGEVELYDVVHRQGEIGTQSPSAILGTNSDEQGGSAQKSDEVVDRPQQLDLEDQAQPVPDNTTSGQSQAPPTTDALSEFLDATSRLDFASTLDFPSAEYDAENQDLGVQDDDGTRSLSSILGADISDTSLFPVGYFEHLSSINAANKREPGPSDIALSGLTVGASDLEKPDIGVFDYGAGEFDNGAFNPNITRGLNLDVFNIPGDNDSGDEGEHDEEYEAIVKEAMADLDSQPNLLPLELVMNASGFFDGGTGVDANDDSGARISISTSAGAGAGVGLLGIDPNADTSSMAQAVADHNAQPDLFPLDMCMDFSQYNAGGEGNFEANEGSPVADLKLPNAYRLTDDAKSEQEAAFVEQTGNDTIAEGERDEARGFDLLLAAITGDDEGLYTHNQGENGAFDADAMARFGQEAGLAEGGAAEPGPSQSQVPTQEVLEQPAAEYVDNYAGVDLNWPHDPEMLRALGLPVPEDDVRVSDDWLNELDGTNSQHQSVELAEGGLQGADPQQHNAQHNAPGGNDRESLLD